MIKKISELIDVKTIVTFVITGVLAYLAIGGRITPEQFMIIATMVYTYFFNKPKTPNEPEVKP